MTGTRGPLLDSPAARSTDPAGVRPPGAPDPDLSGQVAIVTGGAGVIGRAIAARLVSRNGRVIIADVDFDAAERAAASIGNRAVAIAQQADVRSPEAAQSLAAKCVESFGRLDILVNAAGITHVNHLLEVPPDVWRNVFAVNLDGALFCIQAAARVMATQAIHTATECRGKIISVGSQGAEFPIPTSAAYGASKRALNYLTEAAAAALADLAISATVVYPGMVYEGMWRSVNLERSRLRGEDFDDRVRRDLVETPSGQFQDPWDLAGVVLFIVAYRGLGLNGKTVWSEAHVV